MKFGSNKIKRTNVRWKLVAYDTVTFLVMTFIFYTYYRGGGILTPKQIIVHTLLGYFCLFGARLASGVYYTIWRYGGVSGYILLISADMVGAAFNVILNQVLPIQTISTSRIISVATINCLISVYVRMIYRLAYKYKYNQTLLGRIMHGLLVVFAGKDVAKQREVSKSKRNIAILGAGRVGSSLADELLTNINALYQPVCFIDSDPTKYGRRVRGIPVLSEVEATQAQLDYLDVKEIIFAIPGMEMAHRNMLYEKYKQYGLPLKIYEVPVMQTKGRKRVVRSFEVEDVLFRDPIVVTDERSKLYYKDKVILVTGGGGSIGSELSRQVAKMNPKQLILLDIYENGVYDVQQEMKMLYGTTLDIQVEIASITNKNAMSRVFAKYHPQIVINAAAHKHVPLMEHNCVEAVENNVFGTEIVLQLCEQYGAERFMMLSTDKAVNPTNVMGATKRMCEMIMQAYSTRGIVKCSATRFGNVLGSAGSVIPLFRRQIANGGPLTLTDKRIIRYFMTIPEASQLVLQSGAMAKNGELFVLDMGQPVKILDLAENMIKLSGFTPYVDIDIIETGLRPGEKLYEELLVKGEDLDKTDNKLIFIERDIPITMEMMKEKLDLLRAACETGDDDYVREQLRIAVPTFQTPEQANKGL